MTSSQEYVSRGGLKLEHALNAFELSPAGWVCGDLGSHVGGFVDCLLQRGAAKVYSVDTSYGTLAWRLRRDPRVVVMERTNALHVELPEPLDLVTVDVGWTRQQRVMPRALSLIKPSGLIISLLKPHYEADKNLLAGGVLPEEHLEMVVHRALQDIAGAGGRVLKTTPSPLRGHGGNLEQLLLIGW